MFKNVKYKFEENIVLNIPFNKITNKSHILFYVNAILLKIQTMEQNDEDKAEMIGIIQMHISECPFSDCPTKKKERIYLPLSEEWTNRNILEINDKIFLMNFITFIFNFYIFQNYMSPDLYMNLALYYLQIIGNNYLSAFYYNKVSEFKLNNQEKFSFFRLHRLIQKSLIEKLKPTNEPCYNLTDLNTTMYFKYDDLGQKFFDEITSDCNVNLEFWKIFKGYKEKNDKLDFNKIFNLTDKIRISKNKIEKYWEELFGIYNGFNDMFDLYENYVGYINDDGVLCRELELIKNKIILSPDNLQSNFTSVLFSKETGILIANGNKGKEGLIEHVNEQIESIFNFRSEELKGINISRLMPKIFSKVHHLFMEQYNKIGEKRIINKCFVSYGKDRNNNLIPLILRTKKFPILSDYILYISLMTKMQVDDVILLDNKFNIQGMSQRLMERFHLNENIFNDCNIPFYLICKKFIGHYRKNIPKEEKSDKLLKKIEKEMKENSNNTNNNNISSSIINQRDEKECEENFSLEINENAELEFDIVIPPLIQNYISNYSSRENIRINLEGEGITEDENLGIIEEEEDNKVDESVHNETDENQNFLVNNKYINSNNINTHFKQTINLNNINTNNNIGYNGVNNIQNLETAQTQIGNPLNFKRGSTMNVVAKYEDQEIQYKINYFKNLFEKRAFENLEFEMDRINQDNRMEDFRFIFTFENYKFGSDNRNGYVVRCIERSFEDIISYSDGSRQKEILKTGPLRQYTLHLFQNQKSRSSYLYNHLKEYMEYTREEFKSHNSHQIGILKKYFEELIVNKHINKCREEIMKNSKIFIINNNEIDQKQDDKASSNHNVITNQDEFSKKSRIMEIRSNLTKNIDKFYTLRSIKMIFLIMVILAAIFSVVFIIKFSEIISDLHNVHNFSNILTRSILMFSDITANLISLKSLFFIFLEKNKISKILNSVDDLNNLNNIFETNNTVLEEFDISNINNSYFNTFIEDKYNYFDYLKNDSKFRYNNLTDYVSKIEVLMQEYLASNSNQLYWREVENIHLFSFKVINGIHNSNSFNNEEYSKNYLINSLGISILEIITNANEIIKSAIFNINKFPKDFLDEFFSFSNNTEFKSNEINNSDISFITTNTTFSNISEILALNLPINQMEAKKISLIKNVNQNLLKLNYSSYLAIQGAYFIVIPRLLEINSNIDSYLIKINEENLQEILILFISFSSIFIFLSLLFIIFLCLTNSNMQQGLEKVSLIPTEKINDTITKITEFKDRVLHKFIKVDFNFSGTNKIENQTIGKKILEKRILKEKEFAEKLLESKYAFDENRQIKNLMVLNSSYYKALFIVGILAAILIPVFLQCRALIKNSNKILIYKRYIIKDLISINLNILNIKCKISSCEKSQFINRDFTSTSNNNKDNDLNYNYSYILDDNSDQSMNSITNEFSEIYDFFEKKYMLDICSTISEINHVTYDTNSELQKNEIINKCKNDTIIESANHTISLITLIKDSIYNLDKKFLLKSPQDKLNKFSDENFKMIEYIYHNYLNKVYANLEYYIELSLENFSLEIEIFIVAFMILFSVLILLFAIYIYFVYIKTLIHMLSISRCVLRVIPTNVIFDTPKLEAWIETKF